MIRTPGIEPITEADKERFRQNLAKRHGGKDMVSHENRVRCGKMGGRKSGKEGRYGKVKE